MGFQIPRGRRQVEEPSEVIRGRAVAPTAGKRAEAQLGQAIVQAGVATATIGSRILNARARMAREEALNVSVNAANEIQNDLVQFVAGERIKPGLDSIGNVERFDEAFEERIQTRTAELPDELKALTRQRLQPYSIKTRGALANHQQEQRRGVTFSNLDQARDAAIQEAANNPSIDTMESQLASVASTIALYRQNGSIDTEEAQARVADAQQKIITSAINSASLTNPELAQTLVDATKAVLPADIVKTLEADIRKQTKLQKDEQKAVRDEAAQTFTNETIDLAVDGAATITQAQADPRWEVLNPKERETIRSIISKSSPLNKSDPVTLAEVTTLVNTDPLALTVDDWNAFHGRKEQGISTADFNRLFKQWQINIEELENEQNTATKSGIKQAYKILNDARTKEIFDSNDLDNELAWASATQALDVFVTENPEASAEEYTDFVEKLLVPDQKGFIDRQFDFFLRKVSGARFGEPAVITDERLRADAIKALTEAGESITEANISEIARQIEDQRGD